MTTDEIIKLAHEADPFGEHGRLYQVAELTPETLIRFAEAMIEYARANVARNTAMLRAEIEALRAEVERLSRYYKNGIDCFANPCERHSGERTPPFAEFFEKYGGQCLICVVDNNKALQAENERLAEALELMVTTHDEGGWPTATIAIARAALTAYRKQGGEQ